MDVVILGAGSHGTDLRAICEASGLHIVGLLDDNPELGLPRVPTFERFHRSIGYLLGFNRPPLRRRWDYPSHSSPVAIDPFANVRPDLQADQGVVIAAGATIANGVRLGRHVHVNIGANLIRCTIGDYTTVAPSVTVCGDVTIGSDVFIGAHATISNLITIGDGATIGAGAVVVEDVPAMATVVGVPAKPLRVVA